MNRNKARKQFSRKIGGILKAMRKSVGLSQWGMAKRMGITKGQLFGMECGRSDITVRQLADAATTSTYTLRFSMEPK